MSRKIFIILFVVHTLPKTNLFALDEVSVDLEPIVVTAQKREQLLLEVPISITAYDEDFIEGIYAVSFDELSDFVPGVKIQEQSPNNPGFVIRGITTDSGEANLAPRISTYQDGISISRAQGNLVELYDLERIELLKGPQGTLFGRSAQVGAIHLIQNKAVNETSAELSYGMGNLDQYSANGYINTPIVDDKVFLRFAGIHREQRGYVDNFSGSELNGENVWAGRISLGYEPGSNVRGDLIFNYQYDDVPGTAFKSGTYAPPGGSTNPFSYAALNRDEDLFVKRNVWSVTHLFESLISSDWTFNSITGWREYDSTEEFDADGTLAYFLELAENADGEQFSQEFRFNYDPGGKLTSFVGGSFFYEKASQNVIIRTDERSAYNFLVSGEPLILEDGAPNLITNIDPFTFNQNYVESYTNFGETYAADLFIDGTYELTEQIKLTAGVRGTYEHIKAAYLIENDATLFLGLRPGFFLPESNGKISDTEEFASVVGRIAASYAPKDSLNFFATVSRGRRPNVISVDNDGTETLNAEILWNFEVGAKGFFEPANIYYDVSLFHYDYSDFQTDVLELDSNGILVSGARDAGNADAWGFESSLHARPLEALSFFANYAFIDARFDKKDSSGNEQILSGNRFRLTPKHSVSAGLNLQAESRRGTFYIAPNFTWQSQLFFEDTNVPGIEQGSYGLFNAKIGLTSKGEKRWHFFLYGKNLFDKEYLIDAGNVGDLLGIPTFIAGPPLRWGVVANVAY